MQHRNLGKVRTADWRRSCLCAEWHWACALCRLHACFLCQGARLRKGSLFFSPFIEQLTISLQICFTFATGCVLLGSFKVFSLSNSYYGLLSVFLTLIMFSLPLLEIVCVIFFWREFKRRLLLEKNYPSPKLKDNFHSNGFFVGGHHRFMEHLWSGDGRCEFVHCQHHWLCVKSVAVDSAFRLFFEAEFVRKSCKHSSSTCASHKIHLMLANCMKICPIKTNF